MSGERFVRAIRLDAIPEGASRVVHVGGERILVVRLPEGASALEARCTHAGGDLGQGTVSGDHVTCPLHGARFDVRDGSVIRGPAEAPLRCFETRVRDGWLELKVDGS